MPEILGFTPICSLIEPSNKWETDGQKMWHNGIEYRCRWVQYSQSQRHDLGMGIDEPENDRRGKAPGGSARLLQDTAYPNLNYQLARSLHRRRHAHLPPPSASRAVRQHHYRQHTLCGLPRAPCTGMVTKHTKTRPSTVSLSSLLRLISRTLLPAFPHIPRQLYTAVHHLSTIAKSLSPLFPCRSAHGWWSLRLSSHLLPSCPSTSAATRMACLPS